MKALILNSGVGSRMNNLDSNKCFVELAGGITIIDLQISTLLRCGIKEFYITTGYRADKLESIICERYPDVQFTFIYNPLYKETNYIYSIQLARESIRGDDILLLHGDLVFEQSVLQSLLASDISVMVTDSTKPLPEKDFKAVIDNGRIRTIGVDVTSNAVYAQPMYKLLQQDWDLWLDEIDKFCCRGETSVYAENAFNKISSTMMLYPLDVMGRMCFEIDNTEDLAYGKERYIEMPDRLQKVYSGYDSSHHIHDILLNMKVNKPFVVSNMNRQSAFDLFGSNAVYYDEITPNPKHSEVMTGIMAFENEKCDFIVSFGGGSAIDTAKCINMLQISNAIELMDKPRACHLCIPTSAGTGSESTCFAVLYIEGEKISVEHDSIIPDYVVLDPFYLTTLPAYHKKSTLLDALCQSIESLWAKGCSPASEVYAFNAMNIIYDNVNGYMDNKQGYALRILQAANMSGTAINISKTTAAHAMSYKLSVVFGLAHGHAVALCLKYIWEHLLESDNTINNLSVEDYHRYIDLCNKLDISYNFASSGYDDKLIGDLVNSVNIARLNNHPVNLSKKELTDIYKKILKNS